MNRKSNLQLLLEAFVKDGCIPLALGGQPVVEVRIPSGNGALERLVDRYEIAGRHPVVLCGRLFVDQEVTRRRKAPGKPARAKKAPRRRGIGASR
ncbi:MAG: hypothetical protein HY720_26065 [Planctomycetes bacterium]|nr:hypothetical protein [Planctomycetota bacterium]